MSEPIPNIQVDPRSSFELVADMNTAFGNPKGLPQFIDWTRVRSQCLNIPDELGELFTALGVDAAAMKRLVAEFKANIRAEMDRNPVYEVHLKGVRDALCDTHVFAYGAHHLMGIDADRDMEAVVDGVMTRFIKDDADLIATIALHKANGIVDVYLEGEYPTMVMKSARDQPDAPKGKFLKSASYRDTVFPDVE
jgi:hypothetical protein